MAFDYSQHKATSGGGEGDWFKFENVGDKVSGEIIEIFELPKGFGKDGVDVCFSLKTADGSIVKLRLSQVNLIRKTVELEPQVGQTFAAKRLADLPAKPGQSAPKDFEVAVKGDVAVSVAANASADDDDLFS